MSDGRFEKIALIGVGLIGSSIAHAACRAGIADRIVGSARTETTVQKALQLGIIDEGFASPTGSRVRRRSGRALCPRWHLWRDRRPNQRRRRFSRWRHRDRRRVGQGSDRRAMSRRIVPAGVHFVPGHPIAGTEQSGPESGFAELFDNRWCILTPPDGVDPAAVSQLKAFWEKLGSFVRNMTPEHHDLVLAITSHVPHLIAFNIVNTAAHLETRHRPRSDQILRRRFSRLHPHRRLRPDHVARRLPQQQGGRA